ncbi:hypothetical protein SAMD00023353_0403500 [Rosellinia necatrix]|uniref:Uncharacterized protein n=1 Tax=Rosellinia necatrix TaxID=77044 RepID=A0A1S8A5I3_ROSNE|nr:hypothetical protein SAMD00023353_0403500 [Rosellinia necatrix]
MHGGGLLRAYDDGTKHRTEAYSEGEPESVDDWATYPNERSRRRDPAPLK